MFFNDVQHGGDTTHHAMEFASGWPFAQQPAFENSCACGYDGRSSSVDSESDCIVQGLENHYNYPSFRDLPHEYDADDRYYDFSGGIGRPLRHWCCYGEVKEAVFFGRMRVHLETRFGEQVPVMFHLEGAVTPTYFQWSDIKENQSTMCILRPYAHDFMDMTRGIRQESPNTVMVFPATQVVLCQEVDRLTRALSSIGTCIICNKDGAKKCSKCKVLYMYM